MRTIYRCALLAAIAVVTLAQALSSQAEIIRGIATQGAGQFLISWQSTTPGTLFSALPITSQTPILAIDSRPSSGSLFALTTNASASHLYRMALISRFTGVTFPQPQLEPPVPVTGFSHGFDFDPTIDHMRFVNDVNKNYLVHPNTNDSQTGADLFYPVGDPNAGADPNVAGLAYSNNVYNARTTQLYGIDTGLDILVTQAGNAGTLGTVGPLGVDISALAGFDISGETGTAYAAMTPAGSSQSIFYTVNLATGAATPVGPVGAIGGGIVITAMTVDLVPEPATPALGALALLGLAGIRRRWA